MDFKIIFKREKNYLDEALKNNETEKNHIERCITLARSIEWFPSRTRPAGSEFSKMLSSEGLEIFEIVLKRIYDELNYERFSEIQNPSRLIEQIMFVHDLGKYILENGWAKYNGEDHEIRSAKIILDKSNKIGWHENNIKLLHDVTLYHGLFGIIRTGEASLAFLLPILKAIQNLEINRKRLFLDLLIIVTCCDSGATKDSRSNKWYLDDSRVKLYRWISDNLYDASNQDDNYAALFRIASDFKQTVDRIERIVTSGNRNLFASKQSIQNTLKKLVKQNCFDLKRFARTRFDHGFYVFEPLLWTLSIKISKNDTKVVTISEKMLENFLILIELLSKENRLIIRQDNENLFVIGLRNIFSMKDKSYEKRNREHFELLYEAVLKGNPKEINEVIDKVVRKIVS